MQFEYDPAVNRKPIFLFSTPTNCSYFAAKYHLSLFNLSVSMLNITPSLEKKT